MVKMRRLATGLLATCLAGATAPQRAEAVGNGIVTRVHDLGADTLPQTGADAAHVKVALLGVLQKVAGNQVTTWARAQARPITAAGPDLVGLQEVLASTCRPCRVAAPIPRTGRPSRTNRTSCRPCAVS